MSGEILKRIADLSRPVSPPEAWSFLSATPGMRQLPVVSAMMESLEREFTGDQLESARVLVRQQDNSLSLTPILVGEPRRGLFVRRTKDEAPFDIVNQYGSLATNDPPAFGSCHDFFTKKFSGENKFTLATFSDDDLAVLRMLSLPCTPAAGLAGMNGQQVRSLCGHTQLAPATTSQVTTAAVASGGYQLILVGWRLADLINEEPEGLNPVTSRLLKAEEAFQFDLSERVRVWHPTAIEFSRIASAVEFADRNQVRKLMWQSINSSTYSIEEYREMNSVGSSSDYGAARQELLRTLGRAQELGYQSSEVKKALAAFDRSYSKNVVDAILRDAMSAANSVERSLLLTAADLMEHFHQSSELVRSTQDNAIGSSHAREKGLQPGALNERLRLVDGLVKVHRELQRGK